MKEARVKQGDIDWEGRPVEEMETKTENGHTLHITPSCAPPYSKACRHLNLAAMLERAL